MSIPPGIAAKLEAEAMEREGGRRPPPGARPPDANNASDRLRLATEILGTAIDAHEKSGAALKAASRMFLAEFAAAMGAGVDPTTMLANRAALARMERTTTPKVFNASPPDPNPGDSDGHK